MKNFLNLAYIVCFLGFSSGNNSPAVKIQNNTFLKPTLQDTSLQSGAYSLVFKASQDLPVSIGVKSLLFNSSGTKLYALSLEGMCIYEFDRKSKKLLREINFKPTRARGWDYSLNRAIPSFAEKPVEACFSHQDKILWVSLHNAGGVVPIVMDTLPQRKPPSILPGKVAYITDFEKRKQDTVYLPLISTGQIPKVIAETADSKFLAVSNWGSKSVSILKLNDTLAPYGKKIATINLPAIPRGIAVDDKNKKTYVAIMGGNKITVINNKNWKIEKNLSVPTNPRHLLLDSNGNLFISFNAIAQIGCFKAGTGKSLFKVNTHLQPRTIALSRDQRFLFVACYAGNSVDVFKIKRKGFTRIYSFRCSGKPVGIALYENKDKLEAWVSCYLADHLKAYEFKKAMDGSSIQRTSAQF
ncbi:MAG TPA: YncE family protein [Pedobacter sp.]|uniref:YncE family protein n=1 Tax=Pedobacter sp. TaxID=1411316 RepID=UPI002B589551|nr:YncE family protein [Pedobacter sp.]HMI00962.1 YncE family protein [Pedobacter sp.]